MPFYSDKIRQEQIEQDFKFFPRLHRIYAARPNVTPIVLTTALGPHGRKTVWYQNPDNDEAVDGDAGIVPAPHPAPPVTPRPAPPPPAPRAFGADVTAAAVNREPVATTAAPPVTADQAPTSSKRGPKPSSVSREAIENARNNITKIPQKRSLVDTLVEMHEKTHARWDLEAREKNATRQRQLLLEEFKAQIWTRKEYRQRLEKIEREASGSTLKAASPPAKRQRSIPASPTSVNQFSSDWDEIESDSSQ
ncbi:hypothetical protein NLJ89_g7454 [Agrocybe chaxingu]|uniref:Uncharacterized protein n=1 Tax=Agrocybe chaxingu TaxID=84603 RepID=A0A9W8K3L3_9AGAR|nr:hypothetical protein NLJ89_g7454 [Agrocybe chaxingu]